MGSPSQVVNAFLAEWETDSDRMKAAFRRFFTPQTVYENVGITRTVGAEAAIPLIDHYEQTSGVVAWKTEMLAMAEAGDKVLCERIDHLLGADGAERAFVRVMGIFEVEGDKIVAWRDYFDTAPWVSGATDERSAAIIKENPSVST